MCLSRFPFHVLFRLIPLSLAAGSVRDLPAQTTLSAGDVVTIGVTSDANDSFAFVLLRDIEANTVIRFMDHSFTSATGTVVNGTESDMSITFASAVAAGSVVRVENSGTTLVNGGAFDGTKSGTLSGISSDGDQIFIYQGTAVGSGTDFTGRTLLHGLNVAGTNWLTTGSASSNASYLPSALSTLDLNLDSENFDNIDYNGARTGMTATAYRAAFSNIANYTQNNSRFDLAVGGFAMENVLHLHWDANGTTVGDGGTGTWDGTTQSRFKNGASGTTYLRWVDSVAGNDHTAVFGGTAGTVDVASGGVTASGLQFDSTGYVVQGHTITLIALTTPEIGVTDGATATVGSALAGAQGLAKTGQGTLILTSTTSSYPGPTSVNAGVLVINGSHSSGNGPITVANGATLGGTGSITGSATVHGAISPGGNPSSGTFGTLTFAGGSSDVTFAGGGTWLIDIVQGATGDADTLAVGGVLDLGNSVFDPTFRFSGTYTPGTRYILATYGHLDGEFLSFADNTVHTLGGVNGGEYLFQYNDSGAITLTAVPEPGSLLLLGGAAVCWWGRRRIFRQAA